jgi:hypothetical protein
MLARKVAATPQAFGVYVIRRISVAITLGSAVFLVPWTMWLAWTLPLTEKTRAWSFAWVGFDVLMALVMFATAWLGFKRRQLALIGLIVSSTMLFLDAWFDVTFSWDTPGQWGSVLSASLLEVPLGILLMGSAIMIMRRSATLMAELRGRFGPHPSMWKQEFLVAAEDEAAN